MNDKKTLKKYLGSFPAWFDLRKKEILRDKISIAQWKINMNYMIDYHGTIDSCELRAFDEWRFACCQRSRGSVPFSVVKSVPPLTPNGLPVSPPPFQIFPLT